MHGPRLPGCIIASLLLLGAGPAAAQPAGDPAAIAQKLAQTVRARQVRDLRTCVAAVDRAERGIPPQRDPAWQALTAALVEICGNIQRDAESDEREYGPLMGGQAN